MKLEGYLQKPVGHEKFWSVEIPTIGVFTQSRNQKDAYIMAKDAIETVVDKKGFFVTIDALDKNTFSIVANEPKFLIGLLLRHQRAERGLTLMDVAKKLKSNSPNSYGRYEQGKAMPSFEKLEELLKAIDEDLEPILKLKRQAS